MPVTRRQLLVLAAATPLVGASTLGGAVAVQWWDRPPGDGLRVLSDDEYAFLQALAEAWMPPGGAPALSGAEADMGRFFDDVLAGMAHEQAVELKLLCQALDDLPRLTRFAPYRDLDLDARIDGLRSWLHHDQWLLRNAVTGLLALLGTGYTTHPDVVGHIRPLFRCTYGR